MNRNTNHFANYIVAAIAFCLTVGAGEIIVSVITPQAYQIWPANFTAIFTPDPKIMPGVAGDSHFTTNSLGVRGREPASSDRRYILAIGGSTTECLYLDDAETWPQLLERYLNDESAEFKTWVGNAGRSGHTTRNHVFQVEKLLDQFEEIDQVLLMVGVNDLLLRLQRGDSYLTTDKETAAYRRKLFLKSFAVVPPGARELPWYQRLATWQLVRNVHKQFFRQRDLSERETVSGKVYVERRGARMAHKNKLEKLPNLDIALDDFERNVRRIIAHASSAGVEITLITQAFLWRADLPTDLEALLWLGIADSDKDGNGTGDYYSSAALASGLSDFNARLLRICATSGARCIDIAAKLTQDSSTFYDDVHFNEMGARAVAREIAHGL